MTNEYTIFDEERGINFDIMVSKYHDQWIFDISWTDADGHFDLYFEVIKGYIHNITSSLVHNNDVISFHYDPISCGGEIGTSMAESALTSYMDGVGRMFHYPEKFFLASIEARS